eukprot:TRINITY_DN19011_c0_g1_i1.p1 TRINITY_DN19011_c0_g1~~TRINITY_DN19011_c0_g1_i1.p1  ORF type:complete len:270 (-),score=52.32 TRINITY_DN19011_c0_g1_i1:112-921(-)
MSSSPLASEDESSPSAIRKHAVPHKPLPDVPTITNTKPAKREKKMRVLSNLFHFGQRRSDTGSKLSSTISTPALTTMLAAPSTPTLASNLRIMTPTPRQNSLIPLPPSGAKGFMGYLSEEKEIDASTQELENLLRDKRGRKIFRDYLKKEFAEENLLFYEAVEYYSVLPEWDALSEAAVIYRRFLSSEAEYEINLPSKIFAQIRELYDPATGQVANSYKKVHKDLFEQAKHSIFKLLLTDSMPRFIKSPEYIDYMSSAQKRKSSNLVFP